MYCQKCGSLIHDEAVICPNCGCSTGNVMNENLFVDNDLQMKTAKYKRFGMVSLIAGIIIPILGWIFGGIGLVNSNVLLKSNPNDELESVVMYNKLGLIMSSVSAVLIVLVIVLFLA